MSNKRTAHADLLRSLLGTLVGEWGYVEVRRILCELEPTDRVPFDTSTGNDQRGARKREKPTARVLAERVSLPPEQKRFIQILAEKFDAKLFLPSSGDIRYFFEVHGQTEPPTKQRIEAFRKILKLLSAMPESALRRMVEDEAHSGPSRLGPLSEAMRGVGEQRSLDRHRALESVDRRPINSEEEPDGEGKGPSDA